MLCFVADADLALLGGDEVDGSLDRFRQRGDDFSGAGIRSQVLDLRSHLPRYIVSQPFQLFPICRAGADTLTVELLAARLHRLPLFLDRSLPLFQFRTLF